MSPQLRGPKRTLVGLRIRIEVSIDENSGDARPRSQPAQVHEVSTKLAK